MMPSIRMLGRSYSVGDLMVVPASTLPSVRHENGLKKSVERLFLVLHDMERDELILEPISWAVAESTMPDKLATSLAWTRG